MTETKGPWSTHDCADRSAGTIAAMHGLLPDIGIALIAATALGLASHWLRQPVILGYLIAGALVGPIGFGWVHDRNSIETIGEIGLVLLLFIIGLEMDLRQLAASGRQLPYKIYAGTGHGFLKPGRKGNDTPAVDEAWSDILAFYRRDLGK